MNIMQFLKYIGLAIFFGLFGTTQAQTNFIVSSGTSVVFSDSTTLRLDGDWQNEGTLDAGTGTILFEGNNAQNILNPNGDFYDLVIDKGLENVILQDFFDFENGMYLNAGDVLLNMFAVDLGQQAMLFETAGNTVQGAGFIAGEASSLNAPTGDNLFGLGMGIITSDNLGDVIIQRMHTPVSANGGTSIARTFILLPGPPNSGLDVTLVFYYDESELNGNVESELKFFQSFDLGTTWFYVESTLDEVNNTVTASGIDSLQFFTLSSDCLDASVTTNAVCQNITVDLDVTGNYLLTEAEIDGGSTGACGITSKSLDINFFDCTSTGDQPVTLTISGGDGQVSTCQALVTVQDATPPTMTCFDQTLYLGPDGTYDIQAIDLDAGSFDNCNITLSINPLTASCSDVGNTYPITLKGTDDAGNVSTCESQITIADAEFPTALCKDVTGTLNQSGRHKPKATKLDDGSFDNCGIATMTVSPTVLFCTDIGPQNVTLTVTDDAGNQSSCVSVVTIVDQKDPKIRCPQSISVDADPVTCDQVVDHEEVRTFDNCGGETLMQLAGLEDGATYPLGTTINTYEVTDLQGLTAQCSFAVTVNDPGGCIPGAPSAPDYGIGTSTLNTLNAYPNPFTHELNIEYKMEQSGQLFLGIYDLEGHLLQVLDNNWKEAGQHQVKWNASQESLASGIYILRMETTLGVEMRRVVLVQ